MFATCLFCHASLGANESIEHFPVGKRLAFDGAKGRLWVVCTKCGRWNLSPIEERWEAIDEAERCYRDTPKQAATDNVGMAKLRDGTDLIRIGRPLRQEFSAWRYGEIFGERRSTFVKQMIAVGFIGQVASHWGLSAAAATGVGGVVLQLGTQVGVGMLQARRVRIAIKDDDGQTRQLSRGEAWTARYSLDSLSNGAILDVTSRHGVQFSSFTTRTVQRIRSLSSLAYDEQLSVRLTGDNALRALSNMMPAVNLAGGTEREVSRATALVEHSASPAQLFRQIATGNHRMRWQTANASSLSRIAPDIRLALEMSLHEADEHRAMDGELRELEQRWKEAEEIAQIADGLTLPDSVNDDLQSLREKSARNARTQRPDSGV